MLHSQNKMRIIYKDEGEIKDALQAKKQEKMGRLQKTKIEAVQCRKQRIQPDESVAGCLPFCSGRKTHRTPDRHQIKPVPVRRRLELMQSPSLRLRSPSRLGSPRSVNLHDEDYTLSPAACTTPSNRRKIQFTKTLKAIKSRDAPLTVRIARLALRLGELEDSSEGSLQSKGIRHLRRLYQSSSAILERQRQSHLQEARIDNHVTINEDFDERHHNLLDDLEDDLNKKEGLNGDSNDSATTCITKDATEITLHKLDLSDQLMDTDNFKGKVDAWLNQQDKTAVREVEHHHHQLSILNNSCDYIDSNRYEYFC